MVAYSGLGHTFDLRKVITIMKKLISLLVLGLVTLVSAAAILPAAKSFETDENTKWVAKSLSEIESVKVGMTRADLLKVFKQEGGISNRVWQRYVYHECPFIKVDVEFEPVGDPGNMLNRSPSDKIVKISKPFLERSISD